MKKSIQDKLYSRKMKSPNKALYTLIGGAYKLLFFKKYGISVKFNCDIKKDKGPYLLISNHASRIDYLFTAFPLLRHTHNFIVGYNEFFRSHLNGILSMMKAIPKKNFTPDVYTVKSALKVIKKGGRVILFPEGMSSISGANQPVAIGTGKLIKHFRIPVYYSVIKGGYLTSPKYNLKERYGRIEVTFDKMFTPEQLDELSPEQIEDIVNEKLYHDDYKWNKEKQYVFKNDGNIAENLHDLLYRCPSCGKEFEMEGKGNTIRCLACGNGATIKDTYEMIPFDDTCVIPETQTAWFNAEREQIKKDIEDENFELIEKVKIGVLDEYELLKNQATSLIVGEGTLRLNKDGLRYEGTKKGDLYSFFVPIKDLPTYGMCTDVSRFYTFVDGKFIEFYPETRCVEKWFLATEELHRKAGGRWQDFKFEK